MGESSDLEQYKVQLQQVEAALLAEPENNELLKLRDDLVEVIDLTSDIVADLATFGSTSEQKSVVTCNKKNTHGLSGNILWKVGDRCLAPSINGQSYEAVIDGISHEKIAITFVGNGIKHMVKLSNLRVVPIVPKKSYIWESNTSRNMHSRKNEWQVEKERRRVRAQKKAQKIKLLDDAKEGEKKKWQNFNTKAVNKSMKGFKRTEASTSAPDGPAKGEKRENLRSKNDNIFQSTRRGNMESLF